MQRKSLTIFFSVSFLAVCILAGCSPMPAPRELPPQRFAGVQLTVACPRDTPAELAVEVYAKGWESRTGGTVKVVLYDSENGKEPGQTKADVWVLPSRGLASWAVGGEVQPIPTELTGKDSDYHWSSLLPFYREHLLVWDETVYALPLLGDAPLCFYREDLFAQPDHEKGFANKYGQPLRPPQSWQDFVRIAEYFSRNRYTGKSSPSLPPLPAGGRALDFEFNTIAAPFLRRATDHDSFSFHFDAATGKPRIATAGFVEALEMMLKLQSYRPAQRSPEPWRSFQKGEAVLYLGQSRDIVRFQADDSPIRDAFGICLVPGSQKVFSPEAKKMVETGNNQVPYLGGESLLMAVPKSSSNRDAAFNLIAYLSDPRTSTQMMVDPRLGGGAVRNDHFKKNLDAFQLESSLTINLPHLLRETLQPALRTPTVCLRLPREKEFRQALTEELQAALKNDAPGTTDRQLSELALQTLQRVEKKWQALIDNREEEHRAAYRLGLGLRP